MNIAIRKEANGTIYIDKKLRSDIDYTKPPYNFIIIDIGEAYSDCQAIDFNNDLTFNVNKYNDRKQKYANNVRIAELKQMLFDTDYQVLKWKEGELTDEEFEPMRLKRKAWREEIRSLGG